MRENRQARQAVMVLVLFNNLNLSPLPPNGAMPCEQHNGAKERRRWSRRKDANTRTHAHAQTWPARCSAGVAGASSFDSGVVVVVRERARHSLLMKSHRAGRSSGGGRAV